MKIKLTNLNAKYKKVIKQISIFADSMDVKLYLVGGIVRDIILGRNNLDIDIVVESDAIEFSEKLALEFKCNIITYRQFRTATLILDDNLQIDFVTARKEIYLTPGALPKVINANLFDDLFRRDFTVNAMAVSISRKSFGELIDPFNGYKDLIEKKIRIMHDKSFQDDPTRVLRAVRFEQRFAFKIEVKTIRLLKRSLIDKDFEHVTPPRYFNEFKKMLTEKDPVLPLKRLHRLRGFNFIFPGLIVDFKFLSKIQNEKCKLYVNKENDQSCAYWFILLLGLVAQLSDNQRDTVIKKFCFKKHEKQCILLAYKKDDFLKQLNLENLRRSEVYFLLKPLSLELISYLFLSSKTRLQRIRISQYLNKDRFLMLQIDGNYIKNHFDISGKTLGNVLTRLLANKMDNSLNTKNQEIAELKNILENSK